MSPISSAHRDSQVSLSSLAQNPTGECPQASIHSEGHFEDSAALREGKAGILLSFYLFHTKGDSCMGIGIVHGGAALQGNSSKEKPGEEDSCGRIDCEKLGMGLLAILSDTDNAAAQDTLLFAAG